MYACGMLYVSRWFRHVFNLLGNHTSQRLPLYVVGGQHTSAKKKRGRMEIISVHMQPDDEM